MKTCLALVALATSAAGSLTAEYVEANHHSLFAAFKQTHGKNYTASEEAARKAIFKTNMLKAAESQTRHPAATFGMTKFSDLTEEEFKPFTHGMVHFGNAEAEETVWMTAAEVAQYGTNVDWRERGAVSAVKNQAACGSCWSFSTPCRWGQRLAARDDGGDARGFEHPAVASFNGPGAKTAEGENRRRGTNFGVADVCGAAEVYGATVVPVAGWSRGRALECEVLAARWLAAVRGVWGEGGTSGGDGDDGTCGDGTARGGGWMEWGPDIVPAMWSAPSRRERRWRRWLCRKWRRGRVRTRRASTKGGGWRLGGTARWLQRAVGLLDREGSKVRFARAHGQIVTHRRGGVRRTIWRMRGGSGVPAELTARADAYLGPFGLQRKEVGGDGNCLFRCVAAAMGGDESEHLGIRKLVCMAAEEQAGEWAAFVEDGKIAEWARAMARPREWGDALAVRILARLFGRIELFVVIGKEDLKVRVVDDEGCGGGTGAEDNAGHKTALRMVYMAERLDWGHYELVVPRSERGEGVEGREGGVAATQPTPEELPRNKVGVPKQTAEEAKKAQAGIQARPPWGGSLPAELWSGKVCEWGGKSVQSGPERRIELVPRGKEHEAAWRRQQGDKTSFIAESLPGWRSRGGLEDIVLEAPGGRGNLVARLGIFPGEGETAEGLVRERRSAAFRNTMFTIACCCLRDGVRTDEPPSEFLRMLGTELPRSRFSLGKEWLVDIPVEKAEHVLRRSGEGGVWFARRLQSADRDPVVWTRASPLEIVAAGQKVDGYMGVTLRGKKVGIGLQFGLRLRHADGVKAAVKVLDEAGIECPGHMMTFTVSGMPRRAFTDVETTLKCLWSTDCRPRVVGLTDRGRAYIVRAREDPKKWREHLGGTWVTIGVMEDRVKQQAGGSAGAGTVGRGNCFACGAAGHWVAECPTKTSGRKEAPPQRAVVSGSTGGRGQVRETVSLRTDAPRGGAAREVGGNARVETQLADLRNALAKQRKEFEETLRLDQASRRRERDEIMRVRDEFKREREADKAEARRQADAIATVEDKITEAENRRLLNDRQVDRRLEVMTNLLMELRETRVMSEAKTLDVSAPAGSADLQRAPLRPPSPLPEPSERTSGRDGARSPAAGAGDDTVMAEAGGTVIGGAAGTRGLRDRRSPVQGRSKSAEAPLPDRRKERRVDSRTGGLETASDPGTGSTETDSDSDVGTDQPRVGEVVWWLEDGRRHGGRLTKLPPSARSKASVTDTDDPKKVWRVHLRELQVAKRY